MNYLGNLIYRERLRRNWSQDGLCKGICGISYLSKIENGHAEPSDEILRLLLERLDLHTSPEAEIAARHLADEAYEALFCGRIETLQVIMAGTPWEQYRATAAGLDLLLLRCWLNGEPWAPLDAALENCMDARQLALQRILQNRTDEAISLLPNAYCHFCAGHRAYAQGDISRALQQLQTAYDLSAREGAPHLMLQCKCFMGNCHSNHRDIKAMMEHYSIARRLAVALNDTEILRSIDYNTASTQLECGQIDTAYRFFSRLPEPDMMSLHKLAVCCEKLDRTAEAIAALDRADALEDSSIDLPIARQMCALIRFRLTDPDYLHNEVYGRMLLDCFDACRRKLPIGYASFHLPWVLEYHTAARQYKKAFELLSDFPASIN